MQPQGGDACGAVHDKVYAVAFAGRIVTAAGMHAAVWFGHGACRNFRHFHSRFLLARRRNARLFLLSVQQLPPVLSICFFTNSLGVMFSI